MLSSAAQQALGPQRRIKAASKLPGKKRRHYIPPATFCRITENVFNGTAELYVSTSLVKKKKRKERKTVPAPNLPQPFNQKLCVRGGTALIVMVYEGSLYILSPVK